MNVEKRVGGILSLLFGESCVLCSEAIREYTPYPVCEECIAGLVPRDGNLCRICSTSLTSEDGICLKCREMEYAFVSNYSLFQYQGQVKELISQYKSGNIKSLSKVFADFLATEYWANFADCAVVSAPSTKKRKRARGWSQIDEICRVLKKRYHVPCISMLARAGSHAQKTLDYQARYLNLEGRIRAKSKVIGKVVLIDDVFTTGATANACALALKNAGAREVRVLTIAID